MKVFVQVSGPPKSGKTELLKAFRKAAHEWAVKRSLKAVSFTFNETVVRNEVISTIEVPLPEVSAAPTTEAPTPTQEV